MEYRINRRTGDKISVLGLGASYIAENGEAEGMETLRLAYEAGINFFDLASAKAGSFALYGKAYEDVRKELLYQVHFGANYETGEYGWSLDLDTVKRSVDWQLKQLKTDYIDYGFIHCLDEIADFEKYVDNGILAYVQQLQKEGVVHHIGLSSHAPSVAEKVLDTDLVDMLLFSINPAYDYQQGEYARGSDEERAALYRRCEAEGVGISVMKPFSGGQLLNENESPFGKALTENQCLQYALDKPGVLTVVPGVSSKQELQRLLDFMTASAEEKDYSIIGSFTPKNASGKCVYCNHCQPCPAGIAVGLVNKYYDLSKAGDALAKEHYVTLEKKAGDCTGCGHCDNRCPFKVKQSDRMKEIAAYFGE